MTTSRLAALEARWQRFWFEPVPPELYAALRIALGIGGVLGIIGLWDVELYWIPGGLEAARPSTLKTLMVDVGLGEVFGVALFLATVVSTAAMLVGFFSTEAVAATFVLALLQVSWNAIPLSSAAGVFRVFLFCLVWVDCGRVWSVDRWLASRRGVVDPVSEPALPIWPLRLLRFQVCLIYLNSGVWKLFGAPWRDGTALYYALSHSQFGRFPSPPEVLDPLFTLGTYTVLLWELAFALMILYRPTRLLALWFGVALHVGLAVVMDVGPFSLVMLSAYLAFLDPHAFSRLARQRGALNGRWAVS